MSSPEIDAPAQLTPEAKQLLSATVRGLRQRLLRDPRDSAEREYRLAVPLGKAGLGEAQRVRRQRLEHWLAERVRTGKASRDELTGSTFTVSNFGPLGLDDGVPVINHPEAAILGMGAIRPRAVVVDGALAVRSTMRLTCAFDHRVADGAQVAAFLVALRELIEEPDLALAEL